MGELTYTTTIKPPPRKMQELLDKLRKARELVKKEGGTTRLVKNGDALDLTVSAKAEIVVSTIDAVQRLAAAYWSLEAGMSSLFDAMNRNEDARKRGFVEDVLNELRRRQK